MKLYGNDSWPSHCTAFVLKLCSLLQNRRKSLHYRWEVYILETEFNYLTTITRYYFQQEIQVGEIALCCSYYKNKYQYPVPVSFNQFLSEACWLVCMTRKTFSWTFLCRQQFLTSSSSVVYKGNIKHATLRLSLWFDALLKAMKRCNLTLFICPVPIYLSTAICSITKQLSVTPYK